MIGSSVLLVAALKKNSPDMIVTLFLYFLFVSLVFLLVFYQIYSLSLLNLSVNSFLVNHWASQKNGR